MPIWMNYFDCSPAHILMWDPLAQAFTSQMPAPFYFEEYMATLAIIFGMGQKCPSCGQRSSPKINRGNWEVIGLWGGSICKCMKCNSLIRIGFLYDEILFEEESERLQESERISKIISDSRETS